MPSLLFLCHRIPYPPNKGEKIRAYRILVHLARKYRVRLGCFIDAPDDLVHAAALKPLCAEVRCITLPPLTSGLRAARGLLTGAPLSVASFGNTDMAAWVERTLAAEPADVVFLYSSAMAQFIPVHPSSPTHPPMRVIMDFVDVDSDKWRQYARSARPPMSWIYRREATKLLAFDRHVAARTSASVFVSESEAALFRDLAPESAHKTYAVHNGIDCDYFSPAHVFPSPFAGPGPHLVFTGTMDYRPNVDAVTWFAADILPPIRRTAPTSTFTIVGANPARQVTALARHDGITVTGKVDDVRPYLAHASAVVAPLRIARGIQNKILEGMAMGKAVVTTPQGLEGINAIPGTHLLIAETPADIAAAVSTALKMGPSVGTAARHLMETAYGWDHCLAALDRILEKDS